MSLPLLKPYKKDDVHSYILGAYATIGLLEAYPALLQAVYVHSAYTGMDALAALCVRQGVPIGVSDRSVARISPKENCFVVGVFIKRESLLSADSPHIVLVNPSDMGNLGTILRIAAGFNIPDVAVITPGADLFHPKTVRASQGALFAVHAQRFESFDAYRAGHPAHTIFPFMLGSSRPLDPSLVPKGTRRWSLVFGNESSGLDEACFSRIGQPVRIPQSDAVDSLNLSVAVGIASFVFAQGAGLV